MIGHLTWTTPMCKYVHTSKPTFAHAHTHTCCAYPTVLLCFVVLQIMVILIVVRVFQHVHGYPFTSRITCVVAIYKFVEDPLDSFTCWCADIPSWSSHIRRPESRPWLSDTVADGYGTTREAILFSEAIRIFALHVEHSPEPWGWGDGGRSGWPWRAMAEEKHGRACWCDPMVPSNFDVRQCPYGGGAYLHYTISIDRSLHDTTIIKHHELFSSELAIHLSPIQS